MGYVCLPVFTEPFLESQRCDKSGNGRLEHKEIELFCKELMRRPELDAIFRRYSSNGSVLSMPELRDFLGDQGEDASLSHAQTIIHTYEFNDSGKSLKAGTRVSEAVSGVAWPTGHPFLRLSRC